MFLFILCTYCGSDDCIHQALVLVQSALGGGGRQSHALGGGSINYKELSLLVQELVSRDYCETPHLLLL